MSQNLRNLAIDAFRATAETAFQTGSKLRDRVMVISGVEAETQRFPVIGQVDANQRASQADITPANIGNAKPRAILTPREAFDYLDRQDQALTNVEAARSYGMTCGKAVSRQFDADILSALATYDANAYSREGLTAALTFKTGAATTFNAVQISKARAMLMDEDFDVDSEEVTLAYPALRFEQLSAEMQFASMDYMQGTGRPGVARTGRFEEIYGCKPIFFGQKGRRTGKGRMPENWAFMFVKSAVGLAIGTTERMGVVEWVAQKRSYLVGAECNAGATRIQNAGIIGIQLAA